MPRSTAPSIVSSIAPGLLISTKKSAGPPMPNDVREASGSSSLTAGSERSQVSLDAVRQLIAQLVDVSGAHQEYEVVRSNQTLEHLARRLEIADVRGARDLVRQLRRVDASRVLLARAVHIEDQDLVRSAECAREIVHQRRQARVAMWLEHDDEPPVAKLPCGVDRCSHLGRVVGVIVVDRRTLERAQKLQPAMSAWKRFERGRHVGERHPNLEGHRRRAGSVLDVVPPRLAQVDPAQLSSFVMDGKGADGLGAIGGVLAKAGSNAPGLELELPR